MTHHNAYTYGGGTIRASVYLSTNSTISYFDTYLTTHSFYFQFVGKNQIRVHIGDVRVPSRVRPGTYYLGIVIDNSDADVSNNDTSGQDAKLVYVY